MNWLQNIEFELQIDRLPTVSFNANKVNIPGISLPPAEQRTPFNTIRHAPDYIEYENLSITCLVDEDLKSWIEMFKWAKMGFPNDFSETNSSKYKGSHQSDISVIMLNSARQKIATFDFVNAQPVNMSALQLDTTQTERVIQEFTVDFSYDSFSLNVAR